MENFLLVDSYCGPNDHSVKETLMIDMNRVEMASTYLGEDATTLHMKSGNVVFIGMKFNDFRSEWNLWKEQQ